MKKNFFCFFFLVFFLSLQAWPSVIPKDLEPFAYKEDFETNELNGWASYPLWQDTAYDPNLRPGRIVPGDRNLSLLLRVTPYTPVDAYAGAQKKLEFYFLPSSSLSLRYYLKTHGKAEFLKIRLAGENGETIDFTVDAPIPNRWNPVTITMEDIRHQHPKIELSAIKVTGLAVLAKFPQADPAMPIYFGLDDISIDAARVPDFRFLEPETHKLDEWNPYILKRHFRQGDSFRLRGHWSVQADRVEIRVSDFVQKGKVLFKSQLRYSSGEWSHPAIRLGWPEGLYLAELEAFAGKKKVAATVFTLVISPPDLAGRHPRLWFNPQELVSIRAKLQQPRFQAVAEGLAKAAREARQNLPLDKVMFDIDIFPLDEPLLGNVPRSIYSWFDRIRPWRQATSSNALAFALLGDREAGLYGRSLIVKLASFPFWVHPWFKSRGQHIYYPVGELGMDVALAYDLLYELMTEEERKIVRAGLFRNVVEGCHRSYVEDNLVTSNTSNWVAHITGGSLMSQAATYGDGNDGREVEPYFTGVLLKLYDFIQKSIGRDGGYGESYGYCNFTMESLAKALPSLANVFGIDFSPTLELTYQDLAWATLHDQKFFFYFGDSSGNIGPLTNWAWLLARRGDPLLSWLYHFFKKEETLFDVIYDPDRVPQRDPFRENPVRLFRDIGTTVFRSGWKGEDFLFVLRTGAFFNHQHLDQGTFWLADRGEIFIGERKGSTYYDDPYYQSHYTQPVAHSTILIDHNAQSQRVGDPLLFIDGFKEHAFVDHFLNGQETAFVIGDITRLYWGKAKEIRRHVLYLKPRTLLMLDTVVPAGKDVDVTLLYQAGAFQDIEAGKETSFIHKGNKTLAIAHLWPEKREVKVEETPLYINTIRTANPLVREGMLTLTSRTFGEPLLLANLLTTAVEEKQSPVKIEKGEGYNHGLIDGRDFLFSARPGRSYQGHGWSTDALALTWTKDSIFVAYATSLSSEGKLIFRSTEPMTCEIAPGKIKYYLSRPASVSFGQERRPASVLLNKQKIRKLSWNSKTRELEIPLPAGENEISIQF